MNSINKITRESKKEMMVLFIDE